MVTFIYFFITAARNTCIDLSWNIVRYCFENFTKRNKYIWSIAPSIMAWSSDVNWGFSEFIYDTFSKMFQLFHVNSCLYELSSCDCTYRLIDLIDSELFLSSTIVVDWRNCPRTVAIKSHKSIYCEHRRKKKLRIYFNLYEN